MVQAVKFSDIPFNDPAEKPVKDFASLNEFFPGIKLSALQRAALSSICTLHKYLFTDSADERQMLGIYLEKLGYLNGNAKLVESARNSPSLRVGREEMLETIMRDSNAGEILISGNRNRIREKFPALTKSQATLFSGVLQHQVKLDSLDMGSLSKSLPFTITKTNFFGRFIASGSHSPDQSLRHLQLSSPYFVRMSSLIESLCNPSQRFLKIHSSYSEEDMAAARDRHKKLDHRRIDQEGSEIISACVNKAADMMSGGLPYNVKGLAVINIPELPNIPVPFVEDGKRPSLYLQYAEWLLLGKKDGKLLNTRRLTKDDELDYKNLLREVSRTEKRLTDSLGKPAPELESATEQDKRTAAAILTDIKVQTEKLERDQSELRKLVEKRASAKTILEIIEKPDGKAKGIKEFRSRLKEALDKGLRPVFNSTVQNGTEAFYEILDIVYYHQAAKDSEAAKIIRNSAILLSPSDAGVIQNFKRSGKESIVETQLRDFKIEKDEINSSVKLILSPYLPDRKDPMAASLGEAIIKRLALPGINNEKQLLYACRAWYRREKITGVDILKYAFEHATKMQDQDLRGILDTMRINGIFRLPDRCKEIAVDRFYLPPETITLFEEYCRKFKPNVVGSLSKIFKNATSLESYLKYGLDACGMEPEIRQIEHHLLESGIVGIVNSTNYHPELGEEIDDKKMQDSTENTDEIWGDYVRLSERLVRSFALKMIEGDVSEELQNSTVAMIKKPSVSEILQEKLYKKFLGIDLGFSPDLTQVNSVMAEVAVYDPNTTLILDASHVKDFQQYRKFIDCLMRSKLKVIIINLKEAMPGIPHVLIENLMDDELPARIAKDNGIIKQKLGLGREVSPKILRFASDQVKLLRRASDDPLNLELALINSAAQHATLLGHKSLTKYDITKALPAIFHRPDSESLRSKVKSVNKFGETANLLVCGQRAAIKLATDKIISHLYSLRDPTRPLTIIFAGPTGVGKTEFMRGAAMAMNIPFFLIEGSQFGESHTLSRLIGSPNGYVDESQGILFRFLQENPMGLVFVDELEKVHPAVRMGLMNFFDIGILTSGDGQTISRPGYIIAAATNAGADDLNNQMTQKEIKDILCKAFAGDDGMPRQEFIARFDAIVMPAIEKAEFKRAISNLFDQFTNRFGIINANLDITGYDEKALDIIFEASKELCAFEEKAYKNIMGFGCSKLAQPGDASLYYNLRHISRAFDSRAGESIRQAVDLQYATGAIDNRDRPRKIYLVGDPDSGLIDVTDEFKIAT